MYEIYFILSFWKVRYCTIEPKLWELFVFGTLGNYLDGLKVEPALCANYNLSI